MEKLKITILVFLLFIGVNSIQAQDEDSKWALSFGINTVDITDGGIRDLGGAIKDYLGTSDLNTLAAISTVSISRYLNYGLSVKVSGALNKIDIVPSGNVDGLSFFTLNAVAVYDLNSWFGETGWFDPYVQFGFGSTWIDDSSAFTIKTGLGFNTWFNDNVGLSFDSSFNDGTSAFAEMSSSNYFQHSIGLIVRFDGNE